MSNATITDPDIRIANYMIARGVEVDSDISKLTPAQRRRAVKKYNRQNKRVRAYNDRKAAMDRHPAGKAMNVSACPTCGATGDETCRTASDKPTKDHAKRVR